MTPNGVIFYGGDGGRTHDLSVANAALSQLSYTPSLLHFLCSGYVYTFGSFDVNKYSNG